MRNSNSEELKLALAAFFKPPKPSWTFPGLPSPLRKAMEQTVNRGPTQEQVREFIENWADRKQSRRVEATKAVRATQAASAKNGMSTLTDSEIQAEIGAARVDRRTRA